LVNLAIALALILVSWALNLQGWMGVDRLYQALGDVSWQGLLAYLVTSNLTLALFNLVPAFPMDGGRVLRAFLAMRMDYGRATRLAVGIGQALAWGLGLWGFVSGSYTLIFVAVFVYVAAGQERRTVQVKDVLGDVRVGRVMSGQVQVLAPGDTLGRAIDLTLRTLQADFPVVENERLVGFLSDRDLLAGLKKGDSARQVVQVMRRDYLAVSADALLFDVQQQMSGARVRAVPVTEGGQLVGMLTTDDVNEAYRLLSVEPELLLAS
jgi:CBS domain-containing protein